MTGLPAIDRVWRKMYAQVQRALPWFHAELQRDDAAGRCEPAQRRNGSPCRQFGWCEYNEGVIPRISVAGRLAAQPQGVIEGIIAHELGHAILFELDCAHHTERKADQAAELWLQLRLSYTPDDVQTTGPGQRPRPPHLRQ